MMTPGPRKPESQNPYLHILIHITKPEAFAASGQVPHLGPHHSTRQREQKLWINILVYH